MPPPSLGYIGGCSVSVASNDQSLQEDSCTCADATVMMPMGFRQYDRSNGLVADAPNPELVTWGSGDSSCEIVDNETTSVKGVASAKSNPDGADIQIKCDFGCFALSGNAS